MVAELPWVEKYRPVVLADVVGQTEAISRLQSYVKTHNAPNMMFTGPAGIGKTSAAVALAKELYGNEFGRNFLELNASDSRGIDVIRGQIKNFARTLAFSADFKIIFLDESDALTSDAQHALRRTMEKYTKTCRFVLSCNYSSRIIEPLQSRCIIFRFRPLQAKDIETRLQEIAKKYNGKLHGYVVPVESGREDARISFEGFYIKTDPRTAIEVSNSTRPDEFDEIKTNYWRFWWD